METIIVCAVLILSVLLLSDRIVKKLRANYEKVDKVEYAAEIEAAKKVKRYDEWYLKIRWWKYVLIIFIVLGGLCCFFGEKIVKDKEVENPPVPARAKIQNEPPQKKLKKLQILPRKAIPLIFGNI